MASSDSGLLRGSWWFRRPTWLLFVVVFLVGSVFLVAVVVAASIVISGVVDMSEDAIGAGDTVTAATSTTVVAGDPDALIVGQCLDDDELNRYLAGDTFSYGSCEDPHEYEVFFVYEFPVEPYPGDDAVVDGLEAVCQNRFDGYVGRDYESSALDTWSVWPGQGLWENGNRIGECLLYNLDGDTMTGSAYQSGW